MFTLAKASPEEAFPFMNAHLAMPSPLTYDIIIDVENVFLLFNCTQDNKDSLLQLYCGTDSLTILQLLFSRFCLSIK